MTVYLSGGIFPDNAEATDAWRQHAARYFNAAAISVLDPCRGKATYRYEHHTPNEIVLRDLRDIDKADLLFVNFVNVPDKLFTGTQMEILYAWLKRKPVVIVTTDERITHHPWIQALSVRIFSNLDEALDYTVIFWS